MVSVIPLAPQERARLCLDGLSLGDAFGERFCGPQEEVLPRIAAREVPEGFWRYTDDTEMALSIVEVLEELGEVDQDALARRFAERADPARGYGERTLRVLQGIRDGADWRDLSREAGSLGNGAAMRVAPLGGFFAEAGLPTVAEQARLSAEITHSHPEGIAGAVAVAVAAALAWRSPAPGRGWLEAVREAVPPGETRDKIGIALQLPGDLPVREAAAELGNGERGTAPDTVPFCLWVAAHGPGSLTEALWRTVSALGDRDTTCAIVGGILALQVGRGGLPASWLAAREIPR